MACDKGIRFSNSSSTRSNHVSNALYVAAGVERLFIFEIYTMLTRKKNREKYRVTLFSWLLSKQIKYLTSMSAAKRFGPPVCLLLCMIGFSIAAGIYGKKATTTKSDTTMACNQCWYQQQIAVTAIMVIMIFMLSSIGGMYGKISHVF